MTTPTTYRVFVSAVSKELASVRTELARVLRRKGLEVRDQDYFRQVPATLLMQLRDYIRQCDAVILLVGDRCGGMASADHAAELGTMPPFTKYRKGTDYSTASYTQWEFFLAKRFAKPTYIYFTDSGFTPDHPNDEDADLRACQAAFRRWIEGTGEHPERLNNAAELIENVLILPFLNPGHPKPVEFP